MMEGGLICTATDRGERKERIGRWTAPERYLFETLLEKYGKDWKKIGEHLKKRTAGQIRSHAQKYFEKIGKERVAELERRAKVIDAYETLTRENCLPAAIQERELLRKGSQVKEEEQSSTYS
jgi:SHAQKYF class myb-like DNA-binding protein